MTKITSDNECNMTFDNWLAYLQNRFGSLVDENRDFLMNLWSADSVARDLAVEQQERDFAKAELHKQLGVKIDSLRSTIQSIDATNVAEKNGDLVGEYYELKSLLGQKENAARTIQTLQKEHPALCKEFPPPKEHIEQFVEQYRTTITNVYKKRKEQEEYRLSLEQIAQQAQKYRFSHQEFTPPYNKEEVDAYQEKMRAQIELQQQRERFWEDLKKRAHDIELKLEDVSIPYDRDELLDREERVLKAEEEYKDIQAIISKAKELDYDISGQDVTMLFVRKRLWQKLNERDLLWNRCTQLERAYALMGWERIFSTEEKTEDCLKKYREELLIQKDLLQDWRKKTSAQQREQVVIPFPLSKDSVQAHLEKLSFDAKWREKIDDIFQDVPHRPPELPALITEDFVTENIPLMRRRESEIEAWRKREKTKKAIQGFLQKILDGILLVLYRKPKELFGAKRYISFALYITVFPTLSSTLLGSVFFSLTTYNTFGENLYLSFHTLTASWFLVITYLEYILWGIVELATRDETALIIVLLGFLVYFLFDSFTQDSEEQETPLAKVILSVLASGFFTLAVTVVGGFCTIIIAIVLLASGSLPYEFGREFFPVQADKAYRLPRRPCKMDKNTFEKRDACVEERHKFWDDVYSYKDYLDTINDPSKTDKPPQ